MDSPKTYPSRSVTTLARGDRALLHLDGEAVGEVIVKRWGDSWGYADFHPTERFVDYAPHFGLWSLLMHADGDTRLSRAASQELSEAETRLSAIKSRLLFLQNQEWVDVAELNIDGDLLEWKEY